MKKLLVLLITALGSACAYAQTAQDSAYVRDHYTKIEKYIPMRDGVKLFTSIYLPKDQATKYPILMTRTPYNVA